MPRNGRPRHTGNDRSFCQSYGTVYPDQKAFNTLVGWLASRDVLSPEIRKAGVYYDNPKIVPESELRSKACVVLPHEVEVSPPVGLTQIRGGQYAVLLHKGPYSEMHAAYEWLYGPWLTQSGCEAADAPSF